MTDPDEQKLVEQAKTSQQAFGQLFDIYYPVISNYVLRRVGDLDTAEDITAVVFFKAWHGLLSYQSQGAPFSAWLYRIASNEVTNHFRQYKNRPASLEALFEASGFEVPAPTNLEADYINYELVLEQHADFVLVRQLILKLPIKYQEVLTLRYFEQKPVKMIAIIVNKKENTVKSLLLRGNTKLRKAFVANKRLGL